MKLLQKPERVQRHAHLNPLLVKLITVIQHPPLQPHLEAFFHIIICDRLKGPVRIIPKEFVDMIFLPVIFPSGQVLQLLCLIDIIPVIPGRLKTELPRAGCLNQIELFLRHIPDFERHPFLTRQADHCIQCGRELFLLSHREPEKGLRRLRLQNQYTI